MANTQRLDKVENELETVKQLLTSTAQIVDRNAQQIDNLTERIDRNAQQIDILTANQGVSQERLNELIAHSQTEAARVDRIDTATEALQQASLRMAQLMERYGQALEIQMRDFQELKRTTNATLERMDRILDYLIRSLPRNED